MEEWKDVEGYEGLYQVSNQGNVRSLRTNKILKPMIWHGYAYVNFTIDNIVNHKSIHRLVAEAFIPNPDNKPQVDHINTVKEDNRSCNLRWVTALENASNVITVSRRFDNHIDESKPVYQYTTNGEFVSMYKSVREAERKTMTNNSNILKCCNGGFYSNQRNKWVNVNTANGYKWSFYPL